MSDISTSQNFTTGMTVTAPIMNNIIGLASINSSFVSTKSVKSTLSGNDSIPLVDNGGNFWRITGSTLADGLVNAEPNFARIAVGTLQATCPIINGDMQVAQRQASLTALGAAGHTKVTDKWNFDAIGAMTGRCTVAQQAVNFTGTANYPATEFSTRVTITTAQASLAAGDGASISQYVERQFARALFNNPASLQVVLQCSITGTFCVFLKNNNGGTPNQTYVAECVITSANVPQRFTFQAIATMPTGTGTWGTSDTDYAYILGVCLGTGATSQTTAGAWQAGNFLGDANQTNLFATNGATLDITLIQHEAGNICTPFIWVPFDVSLNRCKRYCQMSYEYGTYPGTATTTGNWIFASNGAIGASYLNIVLSPMMRTTPAATSYSPNSGTAARVYDNNAPGDLTVTSVGVTSKILNQVVTSTTPAANHVIVGQFLLDADF